MHCECKEYLFVKLGLEGHYSKWSSQLKSAIQSPKTDKCDCSNDTTTTCCQSLTNGNHAVEVNRDSFVDIVNYRLF